MVTGWPLNLTQTVYGSLPRCSVVAPAGRLLGLLDVGKVTGIGCEQVLPLAVTWTPVILEVDCSQVSLYPQESRAMRAAKEADICHLDQQGSGADVEDCTYVVMLQGNQGPIDKAHKFLHLHLNPSLEN